MKGKRPVRLGLTMRVAPETGYHELRDALANPDWPEFMKFAMPSAMWVPIPNLGAAAVDFAVDWALDGLVLTGGNDIGQFAHKDETDRALLDYALQESLPLLGVCRGMQVMADAVGVGLERCEGHVAKDHSVQLAGDRAAALFGADALVVNSFHQFGVPAAAAAEHFELLAVEGADGRWAEAFAVPDKPAVAVMWHPERGRPFRDSDRTLFETMFAIDAGEDG